MVNRQAAAAACKQVKQACDAHVALSMPGCQSLLELHAAAAAAVAAAPLEPPVDADASISRLLGALRGQQDRQGAVLLALGATLHLPDRPRLAYMPDSEPSLAAIQAAAAVATQEAEAGLDAVAAAPEVKDGQPVSSTDRSSEPLEDYLATYPRIRFLLAKSNERKVGMRWRWGRETALSFCLCWLAPLSALPPPCQAGGILPCLTLATLLVGPSQQADKSQVDKTPLSLVYEYAARLSLEVVVKEVDAGTAGMAPFTLEAQLVARYGGQCFAEGTGRGRSKQLARQAAAAALLDALLATVPEEDLLASNKARQERDAATATAAAAAAARALEPRGGRGSGRGRRGPYGCGRGGWGSGLRSYGPDRSRGPCDDRGWGQEQRGGSRGPYPSREGPPRYREQLPQCNGGGSSGSMRAGLSAQSLSMGRMAPVAASYQPQQYGQPAAQAMQPQVILAAPVAMAMPQMQAGSTGGYGTGSAQMAAGYAAATVQPFMQQQQLGMNSGTYQPGLAMRRTAPASATAHGMPQQGAGGPYSTLTAAGMGGPPYSATVSAPSQPGYSATVPASMPDSGFGTQPAAAAVTQYAHQRQQQHVQAYAVQQQQQEQEHVQTYAMQQQQQQQQQQAAQLVQAQQAYAMQQAVSGYGQQDAMAGGYGTVPPSQTLSPPVPAPRKYISNTSGGSSGGTSDTVTVASVLQRAHVPAAYVQGAGATTAVGGYSAYTVQRQKTSQALEVAQPYSTAYNAVCTTQQQAQAVARQGYGRVAGASYGQPPSAVAQETAQLAAHAQQAYNPTAPSSYWP